MFDPLADKVFPIAARFSPRNHSARKMNGDAKRPLVVHRTKNNYFLQVGVLFCTLLKF
jgi:hypothetical protein